MQSTGKGKGMQEIQVGFIRKTLCLLFMLFFLATSRKSTNTGKYHLLEKRNPIYFLAYFFYFSTTFFTVTGTKM
jgi:hypothetical protein